MPSAVPPETEVLAPVAGYRLKQQILSPLETLAQSVSSIAPSTTPTMTIPLVFALSGNGTWLAYGFALLAMVLVGLCVAQFARHSASPGSLYVYTRDTLPPVFAAIGALALFFAYVTTASSVIGGFVAYAYIVLGPVGAHIPGAVLALVAAGASVAIAYRDIKISTQMMLWIEAVSVFLIALVIGLVLIHHGFHADHAQTHLEGVTPGALRLGVMLAIFSFVGFESATTLGEEARNPLKTIPQAVIRSALFSGVFFILCAYGEAVGFRGNGIPLAESASPLGILADQVGIHFVGKVIDVGVLVSMFAATLAFVICGARVLMLMAHHGLCHSALGKTHAENDTPGLAGLVTGVLAVIPAMVLVSRGVGGADVYGYMGTLAVFGYLTAYGLVAVALPFHLARRGELNVGWILLCVLATGAMLAAAFGTLVPVPPAPLRYLPYVYVAYMLIGLGWYSFTDKKAVV